MQAVIFANGEFIPTSNVDESVSAAELIIAAVIFALTKFLIKEAPAK